MGKEHIPLIDRADSLERRNQILSVAGIIMSLFANGNMFGFASITLPSLLQPDSNLKVATTDQLSWIASLVLIGCLIGTIIGGLISDAIGRKKTIILGSLIYSIGWIVIAHSTDISEILVGRILTGIASGFYSATVQVYICELVEPSMRGVSGTLPTLMVSIGILWVYCIGALLDWRVVALVSSTFPIFVLLYVLFIPESPVWLISQGRQPEALRVLSWLRNNNLAAEEECMHLEYLKERRKASQKYYLKNCCSRVLSKPILKPFTLGVTLFFFQQFSGIYPITFYATLIFNYADNINDYLETVSIGFVRMFFTMISVFLVNFIPRRPLLIASGLLMSLSTGSLGTFFLLRENLHWNMSNVTFGSIEMAQVEVSSTSFGVEWIPLTALLIFMAGYSIGFGIVPWFFIAEVMPSDVRSFFCSLAFSFNHLCLFTTVKTFVWSMDTFEGYGTFYFFSVVAFLGVIFVSCCIPETSNLHPGEIEEMFDQHNSHNGRFQGEDDGDLESTPLL